MAKVVGRGRPRVLEPEAIARAVLEVGFTELTFEAVRARLGVGQKTLYRYAPHRDELVRIALDYAIADVQWPPLDGPWRQVLTDYAMTAWRTWGEYPGAALAVSRGVTSAGKIRVAQRIAMMLIEAGFAPEDAMLACDAVFEFVLDNRRALEVLDLRDDVTARSPREQVAGVLHATPAASDPTGQLHQATMRLLTVDPERWMRRKLDLLLTGIEHRLAPPETRQDTAP